MRTLTWPGVCPGVGSSQISSEIAWSTLDQVDQAGVDDRRHRVGDASRSVSSSRSRRPVLVLRAPEQVARAREGRHPAAVRRGACSSRRDRRAGACTARCRPTSGGKPAAARSARNGPLQHVSTPAAVAPLSLPTQVSTTMRRPARLDDERVDRRDQATSSVAKCGLSQACERPARRSGSRTGSLASGEQGRRSPPDSTIRVTVTSPTRQRSGDAQGKALGASVASGGTERPLRSGWGTLIVVDNRATCSGERLAARAVDRLARMEAVARHAGGVEVEGDARVRDVAARRRPARQRGVVAARVAAQDAAQRLGQEREAMHRRQRREDDVAHARRADQPVGERGAVAHRAPRRHLVDDVVDAGDDDGDVGAERRRRRREARGRRASSARCARAAPTRCGARSRGAALARGGRRPPAPGARRRRPRPTSRRRRAGAASARRRRRRCLRVRPPPRAAPAPGAASPAPGRRAAARARP